MNDPRMIAKLLRALAAGAAHKASKNDVIFTAAADLLDAPITQRPLPMSKGAKEALMATVGAAIINSRLDPYATIEAVAAAFRAEAGRLSKGDLRTGPFGTAGWALEAIAMGQWHEPKKITNILQSGSWLCRIIYMKQEPERR